MRALISLPSFRFADLLDRRFAAALGAPGSLRPRRKKESNVLSMVEMLFHSVMVPYHTDVSQVMFCDSITEAITKLVALLGNPSKTFPILVIGGWAQAHAVASQSDMTGDWDNSP